MKNALRAIELKTLHIMDKLISNNLNLQMYSFLLLFREFEEKQLLGINNKTQEDEKGRHSYLDYQFRRIINIQ